MLSLNECNSSYQENYISFDEVVAIKHFYDEIVNDIAQNNIREESTRIYGYVDGKHRPLRLNRSDNPLLLVIEKLKQDFGNFYIESSMSSVINLHYPHGIHTDINSSQEQLELRNKYKKGQSFIIPLWWDPEYQPGTAFYSTPPKQNEKLYIECQSDLPQFKEDKHIKNFSVQAIWHWKNPGDLLAWNHYTWHSTTSPNGYEYALDKCCKEFIKLYTWSV